MQWWISASTPVELQQYQSGLTSKSKQGMQWFTEEIPKTG